MTIPLVKLRDHQVDAGKFGVTEVGGGTLSKRIVVPGSIVPSGDHIARVAVRLLGTVAELRKRLGDPVEEGEVVAVIESREVADAKSEYLAARLAFDLQQTLFDRSKSLFECKVLSENDFLRARTAFEDARVKLEVARQKLFALGLTDDRSRRFPAAGRDPATAGIARADRRPHRRATGRSWLARWAGGPGKRTVRHRRPQCGLGRPRRPPSDLPTVREGQQIIVTAGGAGRPAIIFVSPLLDKETRSHA